MLQTDGGTRTASITGAAVALVDALEKLQAAKTQSRSFGRLGSHCLCGYKNGEVLLDLNYSEDSSCDTES